MGKYYSVTYRNFLYPTRELLFDNAMCCCLFLHVPNIFHNRVAQTFAKGRIGSLTTATVTRTSKKQQVEGNVTWDDSQRRLLAQHNVETVL